MQLLSFEKDNLDIERNNFGAVSIEIYDEENLLFVHNKIDRIDLRDNQFDFLIKYLTVGDSCHFMVPVEQVVNMFKPLKLKETNSKQLSIFVKLVNVYEGDLDKEMKEQFVLKSYLNKSQAKEQTGIYIECIKSGKGRRIEVGDEVTIAYKGYFMNGLEFDNISEETAFRFTYGTQGQVLKRLEIAIKAMREGQKSKIIIPSQLAFGEGGSTTLIVPPFTSVMYDLEIVKVN
jgi:FKBP-type peptidyl-prolyl cis-trans isomerase